MVVAENPAVHRQRLAEQWLRTLVLAPVSQPGGEVVPYPGDVPGVCAVCLAEDGYSGLKQRVGSLVLALLRQDVG